MLPLMHARKEPETALKVKNYACERLKRLLSKPTKTILTKAGPQLTAGVPTLN